MPGPAASGPHPGASVRESCRRASACHRRGPRRPGRSGRPASDRDVPCPHRRSGPMCRPPPRPPRPRPGSAEVPRPRRPAPIPRPRPASTGGPRRPAPGSPCGPDLRRVATTQWRSSRQTASFADDDHEPPCPRSSRGTSVPTASALGLTECMRRGYRWQTGGGRPCLNPGRLGPPGAIPGRPRWPVRPRTLTTARARAGAAPGRSSGLVALGLQPFGPWRPG
jgi:hypothetical protein